MEQDSWEKDNDDEQYGTGYKEEQASDEEVSSGWD
jgi:hypothetical protein